MPGGIDARLLLRAMRTLYPRVRQSSATALRIAEHFAHDPRVDLVAYPGLASHPGHDIAQRQMDEGFSAILSMRIAGGGVAARATVARLHAFHRATSLGGTESLVEHRATSEGPSTPAPMDLLRFSIGLEEGPEDLIADLDQALDHGLDHGQPSPTPATDAFSALRRTVIARGGDLETHDGPVVAAHDGHIELVSEKDGVVRIRLSGGCAQAQATVRQGIEAVLRRQVPAVVAVIDETAHPASVAPHFPATKR